MCLLAAEYAWGAVIQVFGYFWHETKSISWVRVWVIIFHTTSQALHSKHDQHEARRCFLIVCMAKSNENITHFLSVTTDRWIYLNRLDAHRCEQALALAYALLCRFELLITTWAARPCSVVCYLLPVTYNRTVVRGPVRLFHRRVYDDMRSPCGFFALSRWTHVQYNADWISNVRARVRRYFISQDIRRSCWKECAPGAAIINIVLSVFARCTILYRRLSRHVRCYNFAPLVPRILRDALRLALVCKRILSSRTGVERVAHRFRAKRINAFVIFAICSKSLSDSFRTFLCCVCTRTICIYLLSLRIGVVFFNAFDSLIMYTHGGSRNTELQIMPIIKQFQPGRIFTVVNVKFNAFASIDSL